MKRMLIYAALSGAALLAGTVRVPRALGAEREPAAIAQQNVPSYRDVVKQVLPAIVSIETHARQAAPTRRRDFNLPEEWQDFNNAPPPRGSWFGPGPGRTRQGSGSGFIIDSSGVIVTSYHLLRGADDVIVKLHDGRKFVSSSFKSDPKTDLAIIRIDSKDALPALQWADSAAMEIGDRVLAVGAPYGLEGTVTQGIVSGKGRSLRLNMYEDFIQTDAAINPGNSGGPLVCLEGKVVGVNSVIKTMTGGFPGRRPRRQQRLWPSRSSIGLLKEGVVKRGFLGVQINALSSEVAERLGMKDHRGVLVARVFDDSPAKKAGVQEGDVITALDGKTIETPAALAFAVARVLVGKSVDVTVWRDGRLTTIHVTVEQQPEEFGLNSEPAQTPRLHEQDRVWLPNLGVAVVGLAKGSASRWGFSETAEGALVVDVEHNSPAALSGIRTGDLIQKVDGKQVATATAAKDAVRAGSLSKGILLQIRSEDRGLAFVMLRAQGD